MPSFILTRPTVWPQCTNVTDRTNRQDRKGQDRTDRQTDRQQSNSTRRIVLQMVAQKTARPTLSDRSLSVHLSVTLVYCGQTAGWMKMPLGTKVGLGSSNIVFDANPTPPPPPRGRALSQFSAHVCCGQTAGWIQMPLGTKVGFGPGHIVLHGYSASPYKEHSPQFSAHVYFGQTVVHLSYC